MEERLTRAHKVPANPIPKVMENAIAMRLQHLGVRVETRVTELGNLLREEFDALC